MFASQYWKDAGCAPDILATAKSIAGGVPLSAITARAEIMDAVPDATIGGTFCGNALACASALTIIDIMEKEDFAGKAVTMAEKLHKHFDAWKEKYELVGDVRGTGCMMGIEFVTSKETKEPATKLVGDIVQYAAHHGLVLEAAGTYSNVIRCLAPLVMTDEQLEAGCAILEEAIVACSK